MKYFKVTCLRQELLFYKKYRYYIFVYKSYASLLNQYKEICNIYFNDVCKIHNIWNFAVRNDMQSIHLISTQIKDSEYFEEKED